MNKFRGIIAAALTGLGLLVAGFVAIPSVGNAGVPALSPAERVSAAFDLLAEAGTDGAPRQRFRTVTIGYQTDTTAPLLLRTPGPTS